MYQYNAKVLSVYDGDTFTVSIDLGFDISIIQSVRLLGIDTPELNSTDPKKKTAAKVAKEYLQDLFHLYPNVLLDTAKGNDKYGRYLAKVTVQNGPNFIDVAKEMIGKGLGVPYLGGKKV